MKIAAILFGVLCLWSWKPASAQQGQVILAIEEPTYTHLEGVQDPLVVCVVVISGTFVQPAVVMLGVDLPFFNDLVVNVDLSFNAGGTRMCGSLNFPDNGNDDGVQSLTLTASSEHNFISFNRNTAALTLIDDDVVELCPSLLNPTNGAVTFSNGLMVGSVALYSCNQPYVPSGGSQRICGAVVGSSVMWSGSAPTCNFPNTNDATISFQLSEYAVMEGGTVDIGVSIDSGHIGIPFGIWFQGNFGSVRISFHLEFGRGLVVGNVVTGTLTASNDNELENNSTFTIPLEIPGDVSGVTVVRNQNINLFFIDNDGPDVNECALGVADCGENTVCRNTVGSYTCDCISGFMPSTGNSCTDINECNAGTHNCFDPNGACLNFPPGSFQCVCNTGFFSSGVFCNDINECTAGTHNCLDNAECMNNDGGFSCVCNPGYAGDGIFTCSNIQECFLDLHDCSVNGACQDTQGGFNCLCNPGYTGDGRVCSNLNECALNTDTCDDNAICTDNDGSFDCACRLGFIGDGDTCSDINECTTSSLNNCDDNAACSNTDGSFACNCNPGYFGSGTFCSNSNECLFGQDNCDGNATCADTQGSFTCTCNDNFFGDGVTCMPDMVQLSLVPHLYSVLEGGSLEVSIEVYNPSDEATVVFGNLLVSELGISSTYSFLVAGKASFTRTTFVMFPNDDILNEIAENRVNMVLEVGSQATVVLEGYDSAVVIVIDDDIVKIGFVETEVYVREGDEMARVCVELLVGSGCQRPIVLRLRTREIMFDGAPADEGDDFIPVWKIGSININAEQGREECFYVEIREDFDIEQNETFHVILDVVDVNVYVLVDTVTITIIDDDNITRFCPELSVNNGYILVNSQLIMGEQSEDTIATYGCNSFYMLAGNPGSNSRTCQADGTWSGVDLFCQRGPFTLGCTSTVASPSGPAFIACNHDSPATIISRQCDSGDGLQLCSIPVAVPFEGFSAGQNTYRVVFTDSDGIQAEATVMFTVPNVCPLVPGIANGAVNVMGVILNSGYVPGAVATYVCNNLFMLDGFGPRICLASGEWDRPAPTCVSDPIDLTCTSTQPDDLALLPDLMCSVDSSFPVSVRTCSFDGGLVVSCDIGAPLSHSMVSGLEPGDHTVLVSVTDTQGGSDSFLFEFTISEPLELTCMQQEVTSSSYSFRCTAATELTSQLLCMLTGSDNPGAPPVIVSCFLNNNNTIENILQNNVLYTLVVTAMDIFGQEEMDSLSFSLLAPTPFRITFTSDTPEVDDSDIKVNFEIAPGSIGTLQSAICAIDGPDPISTACDIVSATTGMYTFSSQEEGRIDRTITITAISTDGQQAVLSRDVRPGLPVLINGVSREFCSVHLINQGVIRNGDDVTVLFGYSGPLATTPQPMSFCALGLGSDAARPPVLCTNSITYTDVTDEEFIVGLSIFPISNGLCYERARLVDVDVN